MKKDEKTKIISAINDAVSKCRALAEETESFIEKQYQWGQADGLDSAAAYIARQPEE
jgi:hypothetical protein